MFHWAQPTLYLYLSKTQLFSSILLAWSIKYIRLLDCPKRTSTRISSLNPLLNVPISNSSPISVNSAMKSSNYSRYSVTVPVCFSATKDSYVEPLYDGQNLAISAFLNVIQLEKGVLESNHWNQLRALPSIQIVAAYSFSSSVNLLKLKYRSALKTQPSGSTPLNTGNSNFLILR